LRQHDYSQACVAVRRMWPPRLLTPHPFRFSLRRATPATARPTQRQARPATRSRPPVAAAGAGRSVAGRAVAAAVAAAPRRAARAAVGKRPRWGASGLWGLIGVLGGSTAPAAVKIGGGAAAESLSPDCCTAPESPLKLGGPGKARCQARRGQQAFAGQRPRGGRPSSQGPLPPAARRNSPARPPQPLARPRGPSRCRAATTRAASRRRPWTGRAATRPTSGGASGCARLCGCCWGGARRGRPTGGCLILNRSAAAGAARAEGHPQVGAFYTLDRQPPACVEDTPTPGRVLGSQTYPPRQLNTPTANPPMKV
jgi:hypothetical protein